MPLLEFGKLNSQREYAVGPHSSRKVVACQHSAEGDYIAQDRIIIVCDNPGEGPIITNLVYAKKSLIMGASLRCTANAVSTKRPAGSVARMVGLHRHWCSETQVQFA